LEQPPVITKLVMENYEGGGEKFLPVTCMGLGMAPVTDEGQLFL